MGLVYKVFLPATVDSDVVKRTLKVVINGIENTIDLPGNCIDTTLNPIAEGSNVALSLQDTDDAGNSSGWSQALVFSAVDTIIPATPGMISVKLTAEVADTPAPPPDPAPVTPAPPVVEPVAEVPAPAPEPEPVPPPPPVVEGDVVLTPVEPPPPTE